MGIHSLEYLLAPGRIAVLGAGDEPGTLARILLTNLITSGFKGTIFPVQQGKEAVFGIPAYPDIREVPKNVDLAVLAGPASGIVSEIEACAEKGVRSVLILAPDFRHRVAEPGSMIDKISSLCRARGMRCLGPNSMGFIRPRLGLNVSTSRASLPEGRLAFISQSATLAASILDYAASKHVGFSTFVSLGAHSDVEFADLIDFLGIDPETRGIVLYMESVKDGRRFVSAARAFARAKPLVVVKGGKTDISAQVAFTHTGTLAGEDKVYDAVFKRAGMVRVEEVLELFHISEALTKQALPGGNRLLIVTNAGGPAVMATDTLIRYGGRLAKPSQKTLKALNGILPEHWHPHNPLDVLSDASAERYAKVVEVCLEEDEADAVLVVLTPQYATEPVATAERLVEISTRHPKRTLLACWMGAQDVSLAREILNRGGIPTFVAPEDAVRSFVYMHTHDKNLRLLYETPANILEDFHPDGDRVEGIFKAAVGEGRTLLTERESKEVFGAYGIPAPPLKFAKTADEAEAAAAEIGFPVAVKVESPDVAHKGDVGGVMLHVGRREVGKAFEEIRKNLTRFSPDARFMGVTIQPMVLWPGYEVAIGTKKDPTFGSVIVFGVGGAFFEAIKDYSVGLPPLNQTLARILMEDTKIYRYLTREGAFPRPKMDLLEQVLLRFSQLIVDFPEIREIDINPFYLGPKAGVCLDGRIVLEKDVLVSGFHRPTGPCCPQNLSICPYPCHYIDTASLKNGLPYVIRPIRPEDEPLLKELFYTFSPETILMRFFQPLTDLPHEQLVRYCQVDYTRENALVASLLEEGRERLIGVGRMTTLPDGESVEMAVVVGDPWQRQGVGATLVERCLSAVRSEGKRWVYMDIMRQNEPMRHLAEKLGFESVPTEDEDFVRVRLDLYHKGKGKKRKTSGAKTGTKG